ncbi:unnamed protein product [Pedinophyceae sp. YPF-701]|nr:unnamed protein product [Pedinophyceae sp. YPF-701]
MPSSGQADPGDDRTGHAADAAAARNASPSPSGVSALTADERETTANDLTVEEMNAMAGEDGFRADGTRCRVTNKAGFLCHIEMDAIWQLSVAEVVQIFSNPCNAAVFRDIAAVPHRAQLYDFGGGNEVVEVEQQSEVRFLWVRKRFSTLMHVRTVPPKSPTDGASMEVCLAEPGILTKFHGKWSLRPADGPRGPNTACIGTLQQEVLPAGIPAGASRVPFVGRLLRGMSVRAIRRIIEDMRKIERRVLKGEDIASVLRPPGAVEAPLGGPDSVRVRDCKVALSSDDLEVLRKQDEAAREAGASKTQGGTGPGIADAPALVSVPVLSDVEISDDDQA